tara:strand:- start:121975 stop:125217 length:3243 start_codon:yes stop_codon:yes gene_type:complete
MKYISQYNENSSKDNLHREKVIKKIEDLLGILNRNRNDNPDPIISTDWYTGDDKSNFLYLNYYLSKNLNVKFKFKIIDGAQKGEEFNFEAFDMDIDENFEIIWYLSSSFGVFSLDEIETESLWKVLKLLTSVPFLSAYLNKNIFKKINEKNDYRENDNHNRKEKVIDKIREFLDILNDDKMTNGIDTDEERDEVDFLFLNYYKSKNLNYKFRFKTLNGNSYPFNGFDEDDGWVMDARNDDVELHDLKFKSLWEVLELLSSVPLLSVHLNKDIFKKINENIKPKMDEEKLIEKIEEFLSILHTDYMKNSQRDDGKNYLFPIYYENKGISTRVKLNKKNGDTFIFNGFVVESDICKSGFDFDYKSIKYKSYVNNLWDVGIIDKEYPIPLDEFDIESLWKLLELLSKVPIISTYLNKDIFKKINENDEINIDRYKLIDKINELLGVLSDHRNYENPLIVSGQHPPDNRYFRDLPHEDDFIYLEYYKSKGLDCNFKINYLEQNLQTTRGQDNFNGFDGSDKNWLLDGDYYNSVTFDKISTKTLWNIVKLLSSVPLISEYLNKDIFKKINEKNDNRKEKVIDKINELLDILDEDKNKNGIGNGYNHDDFIFLDYYTSRNLNCKFKLIFNGRFHIFNGFDRESGVWEIDNKGGGLDFSDLEFNDLWKVLELLSSVPLISTYLNKDIFKKLNEMSFNDYQINENKFFSEIDIVRKKGLELNSEFNRKKSKFLTTKYEFEDFKRKKSNEIDNIKLSLDDKKKLIKIISFLIEKLFNNQEENDGTNLYLTKPIEICMYDRKSVNKYINIYHIYKHMTQWWLAIDHKEINDTPIIHISSYSLINLYDGLMKIPEMSSLINAEAFRKINEERDASNGKAEIRIERWRKERIRDEELNKQSNILLDEAIKAKDFANNLIKETFGYDILVDGKYSYEKGPSPFNISIYDNENTDDKSASSFELGDRGENTSEERINHFRHWGKFLNSQTGRVEIDFILGYSFRIEIDGLHEDGGDKEYMGNKHLRRLIDNSHIRENKLKEVKEQYEVFKENLGNLRVSTLYTLELKKSEIWVFFHLRRKKRIVIDTLEAIKKL